MPVTCHVQCLFCVHKACTTRALRRDEPAMIGRSERDDLDSFEKNLAGEKQGLPVGAGGDELLVEVVRERLSRLIVPRERV